MTGLWSIAVASLFGSMHCVGMCGGLIGFYAGADSSPGLTRWAAHGAYHFTRLLAYAALGALAGQLGAGLDGLGRGAGAGNVAALLAGSVMLVWGASLWPRRPREPKLFALRAKPPALSRLWRAVEARFAGVARAARGRPPVARAALLGLSSALLPCGWLYAFVVLAAGSGSAGHGALLLAAFWSGTVPALLGVGLSVQALARRWKAALPRLSAVLLCALGALNVVSRWPFLHSAEAAAGAPLCHHVAP